MLDCRQDSIFRVKYKPDERSPSRRVIKALPGRQCERVLCDFWNGNFFFFFLPNLRRCDATTHLPQLRHLQAHGFCLFPQEQRLPASLSFLSFFFFFLFRRFSALPPTALLISRIRPLPVSSVVVFFFCFQTCRAPARLRNCRRRMEKTAARGSFPGVLDRVNATVAVTRSVARPLVISSRNVDSRSTACECFSSRTATTAHFRCVPSSFPLFPGVLWLKFVLRKPLLVGIMLTSFLVNLIETLIAQIE